jgi:hypothetical protein
MDQFFIDSKNNNTNDKTIDIIDNTKRCSQKRYTLLHILLFVIMKMFLITLKLRKRKKESRIGRFVFLNLIDWSLDVRF